jgi:hypothetical protein
MREPRATGGTSDVRPLSHAVAYVVAAMWTGLLIVAGGWGGGLRTAWPEWPVAFTAAAVWGANALILVYGIGRPFALSRLPVLSVAFAVLMTVFGSTSYWATTQLFPLYRVFIERAALFVAVCTLASLIGCLAISRLPAPVEPSRRFVWDWDRLQVLTIGLTLVCAAGTWMSVRRIGYLPVLRGDPESLRVEFPAIAGVWFRFSALGIVVGLLAGAQICARRATWPVWASGIAGPLLASVYGNRFFIALPMGAVLLLWDQVRSRVTMRTVALGLGIGIPVLALLGFWREQDAGVGVLGPAALVLYGTLGEFRDIGWTLDYYSGGSHALLHGSTLGGLVVPLLPSAVWSAIGVDKAAVFAHSNAAVLAQEMGQFAAQRVGVFGELFMNFGWGGAVIGAAIYGMLIGYLDRHFLALRERDAVRGILLAVIAAATIYAQVGQWNMLTATITSSCYPILLIALFAARRVARTV